jgi:hypothetical protein
MKTGVAVLPGRFEINEPGPEAPLLVTAVMTKITFPGFRQYRGYLTINLRNSGKNTMMMVII